MSLNVVQHSRLTIKVPSASVPTKDQNRRSVMDIRADNIRVAELGMNLQRRKVQGIDRQGITGQSINTNQFFNNATHLKNAHMNEIRKKKRDFFKRINYCHTITVVVLPLIVFICMAEHYVSFFPENQRSLIFSCIYFNLTFLAFNSGYHKLFAHRTFTPKYRVVALFLAVFGSSLGLGPIRWWAGLHRAHHQFCSDPERNPYLIKRGFLWAHWGWLIKKPKDTTFYERFIDQEFPSTARKEHEETLVEIEDEVSLIDTDSQDDLEIYETLKETYEPNIGALIIWQEKYYFLLFLLTTFLIPAIISVYLCNDSPLNGVIYIGIVRMFFAQQCMLSTESLCHMKNLKITIGVQSFNDTNSAMNCMNPIVDILTFGQSQQNYHHEFPHDYRCSSSAWAFDPTKWFIWSLYALGLVEGLCKTPNDLITQLLIQQQQELINRVRSQLNWGTPISKLPLIKPKEFKKIISSASHDGRIYIIIQNIIHDVTPFIDQHPGGAPLLKASHAKDATKAFYGGVYGHLAAAINLLATMRIGVLDVGNKEEVWTRVANEERKLDDSKSGRGNRPFSTAEAA